MPEDGCESLEGKVALVTGAARRIGAEIAHTLHEAGANLAIHYRHSDREAKTLCEQLNSVRTESAMSFPADLVHSGAADGLIDAVLGWSNRLDILINNASSFYPTPLGEVDDTAWLDLIGSNLKAPMFLSQSAAPHLRDASGNIVNIVDIHALRPLRDHHVYGAAKAGLLMLTKSLATDLAPLVRVNGVSPGAIEWPEDGMPDAVKQNIIEQIPLEKIGDPSDIANAVLFLVRDATFVTGQILPVDGGRSIGW